MASDEQHLDERITTGIPGLDEVLCGGLPSGALYLLQGNPGVGKTTLALQFLLAGRDRGERCLYVTLSETGNELEGVTRSHGWSLDGITLYDLAAARSRIEAQSDQTMFHPAEVELEEVTAPVLAEVDRIAPQRLVIDSLSEIRLLAREPLRYRRQLLDLKQFFLNRGCTVILIDDKTTEGGDGVLQTLAHGVVVLEKRTPKYGTTRRRLSVEKLRGVAYREGYHDYKIERGGIVVHPRLAASRGDERFSRHQIASGIPGLDAMLGGGLDRGTSTLLLGAAGTGKSSLATQYALAAARRGEKSRFYAFEEVPQTWRARAESLGMDVAEHEAAGRIVVTQVDPAELSPGELATDVRAAVESGVRLIVLDSLNGYLQSVPEEGFLVLHLHELLTYLAQKQVTTIITVAQSGMVGAAMTAPIDVSYLADSVMSLRYFESQGAVRQAISVIKKRSGKHERTIREFGLDDHGIHVGDPLTAFHGVLTGVPTYVGDGGPLLEERDGRTEE